MSSNFFPHPRSVLWISNTPRQYNESYRRDGLQIIDSLQPVNYQNGIFLPDLGLSPGAERSDPSTMNERVTPVALQRGLFVLRYVRSSNAGAAPTVMVRPARESQGDIEVISAPDDRPGLIAAPGHCLVVRAERSGTLQVTVTAVAGGGAPEAELRLEPLQVGRAERNGSATETGVVEPFRAVEPSARGSRRSEPARPRLEVLGHVSRRGDVFAGAGEWIAGPDAPAPIEGVALRALEPLGVGVEYQALIGGPGGGWTRWTADGYAGTRGKFLALHGIRLRLTGPEASAFEFETEALFLGAPTVHRSGREVELSSISGADPLVGLKVAVITAQTQVSPRNVQGAEPLESGSVERLGRVRVFRATSFRS